MIIKYSQNISHDPIMKMIPKGFAISKFPHSNVASCIISNYQHINYNGGTTDTFV